MIFGVHINQILTNVQKQFSISILNVLSVVMFYFIFWNFFGPDASFCTVHWLRGMAIMPDWVDFA